MNENLNEKALTTLPYYLPDQSQELLGVARSTVDKAPSAARLSPHYGYT